LLAENPDIPLAALIHKATAYLAQDAPKRPGISRVKRTEWGGLSEEDLRRRYADGPESEAYDRFKQAGLILDLRPLLKAI
ncbi:TPA: ATP-binding protein, partial [Escherichia coli]